MRHPVESCIRGFVSFRERATKADLADYGLNKIPAAAQQAVLDAIDECLLKREAGEPRVDQHATELASEIVASLPKGLQDPRTFRAERDPLAGVTDPDRLAQAVPRGNA